MATFKARARALDMLGRQQIAGIPTAVSELFKNAHDAYARRAEVDLYRDKRVLLLRDDGVGMTAADFTERWLTLGTDSKLGSRHGLPMPSGDSDLPPRPIMGEKGIGRLAISTLGSQVLVLTRPRVDKTDGVVALLNWRLFESPGLDLGDISVPTRPLPANGLPDRETIKEMLKEGRTIVDRLSSRVDPLIATLVREDLASFPTDLDAFFTPRWPFARSGSGTAFLIHPVEDTLLMDLQEEQDDRISPLVRMLIGFTNSLRPEQSEKLGFRTAFRDHRGSAEPEDVIADSEFFTVSDFERADHRIQGEVDEFGRFAGTVSVYDAKPTEYEVAWPGAGGKPTACGGFALQFAYVQGEADSTRLAQEDYAQLSAKLSRLGGIYIYRDGIRVLPYGNTDFDFLDIERRRSQNAAHYFFSYRRMFGSIDISRASNPDLQEKAGREGFRANKAYRQFKGILENLLKQLAAEFFRAGGKRAESWQQTRDELKRNAAVRHERDKQSKLATRLFRAQLGDALERTDKRRVQHDLKKLFGTISEELASAARRAAQERAPEILLSAEDTARRHFDEFRQTLTVESPRGFALTKELRSDWNDYLAQVQEVEKDLLEPSRQQLDQLVTTTAAKARVALDRAARAERALKTRVARARETAARSTEQVEGILVQLRDSVSQIVGGATGALETTIATAVADLTKAAASKPDDAAFRTVKALCEKRVEDAAREHLDRINDLRQALLAASAGIVSVQTAGGSLTEALEEELLALRERADRDLGLTQLGMAVEVINHEFVATIKSVRAGLTRLKGWSDVNDKLRPVYESLRSSFDHLDGYLNLFTPLQRRTARTKVAMKGSEIADFLASLFADRVARHGVTLSATPAFRRATVHGFPSTLYPVFVNLVDNAIYWVCERKEPRVVTLDARGAVLVVTDTGPGVRTRDKDKIFEPGFSRKPGGRGLGLFISRETLTRDGFTLTVDAPDSGPGAEFLISHA